MSLTRSVTYLQNGHSHNVRFYDIAWTPLAYSYSSEILPYEMRTKGMAIFVAVQSMSPRACVTELSF